MWSIARTCIKKVSSGRRGRKLTLDLFRQSLSSIGRAHGTVHVSVVAEGNARTRPELTVDWSTQRIESAQLSFVCEWRLAPD
jgi:hypothetical protein